MGTYQSIVTPFKTGPVIQISKQISTSRTRATCTNLQPRNFWDVEGQFGICLRGRGPSRCLGLENIWPKRVGRFRSYKSWRVDSEFLLIKSMYKMSTYEGTKAKKRKQIIQHITRGESCQWTHKGTKIFAPLGSVSEYDAIISVINVNSFRDLVYVLPNELAYGVCKASNYRQSHIRGRSYIPTLVLVVEDTPKVTFSLIEGTVNVQVSLVEVFTICDVDSLAVASAQVPAEVSIV